MPSSADTPLLVRRFDGVNIADEPVFIGPSFLQSSQNWLPDLNYQLATRRGTAVLEVLGGDTVNAMLRTYDDAGNRYLFVVLTSLAVPQVFVAVNDGTFNVVGVPFTPGPYRYGMTVLGQSVYVGNGVDYLRRISLPALTSETLAPLPVTDDTGQAVTTTADASMVLQTGTYSYAWAVYDTAAKVWISVGPSRTYTLSATSMALSFTAPATVLPANQTYHLFVTAADAAVETAHDQVPEGVANGATLVVRTIVLDGTPIPLAEVGRRGNILVAHRNRVWFAGDRQKPSRFFATSTIVPGLEQAIFDIGDFFPWDAEEPIGEGDGDLITGMAVAALTSTQASPASPMAIYKGNSTWLFLGDITDDPTSQLVQISGEAGCIAPATVQTTRWGVIACGRDTLYLTQPQLTEPLDIGWPIAPFLRSLDPETAARAFAWYQLGFYHLCFPDTSGEVGHPRATIWSLDLRRGPGAPRSQGPVPSWWGPHKTVSVTAATVGRRDPSTIDRTFLATEAVPAVVENEQPTATEFELFGDDPVPIVSVLKSAALDGGDAFGRKTFQRVRLRGRPLETTQVEVCLIIDEMEDECRIGQFPGGGGGLWDFGLWDDALWSGPGVAAVASDVTTPLLSPTAADGLVFGSQSPTTAPQGRATGYQAEILITHAEPVLMTLRDIELRYLPRDRPVP